MGVVEAKLSVKTDEPSSSSSPPPPPPPPTTAVDVRKGILIALKLEEDNPADSVGTPGIDGPDDDAGPGEDRESPKKGEEKGVAPRLPQRPNDPDCSFYLKTGTCKFGLNCKFNHPLQKRRLRAAWGRLKHSDDVQAAKDEHEQSDSKMFGQTTDKYVIGREKGTPFKKMEQTEKKVIKEVKQTPPSRMEQKDHRNIVEKPKGTPFKKVEQTDKKAVQEEKQNSSIRMKQEDPKVVKEVKQTPPSRMEQKDHKNIVVMPKGTPFKKVEQTDKKAVQEEKQNSSIRMKQEDPKVVKEVKQTPPSRMEQKDHKNIVVMPKGTPFKKVEQTDKKAVQEEKQNSSIRMKQEDPKVKLKKKWKAIQVDEKEKEIDKKVVQAESEVVKDKQSPPQKMMQEDNKVVTEKQILSYRMQHQDNKVAKETSKKTTAEKVGVRECKVDEKKKIANNAVQAESEVVKDKGSPLQRMKQEDNKGVMEKQIPYDRMQHQDNKAAKKTSRDTTAEKFGVIECKYHKMPGGCKFGKSCKFVHSQKEKEVHPVELNFLGLPIRPGEQACLIYMRTGNCKDAANCKYHHPDPTVATVQQEPLPECQSSQSMQQIGFGALPVHMMANPTEGPFHRPTSFVVPPPSYSPPGLNLHPQGLHENSGCNGCQVHAAAGYPDGSGQLECQYFLRFGFCNFGSACQFHHPQPRHIPANSSGTFTPIHPLQ